MKLPIIRTIADYIEENSIDDVEKSISLLEHISQTRGIKDEELEIIGELISNMSGSLEVTKMIQEGTPKTEALNGFMKRVIGSIDR